MKIAYGNSRMEKKWKNNEISWEDFCKRVSTTQTTTETVDEYRKMSKPQQDAIKDVGGFVAGHLKAGRRKNGTVLCRSMLTLDMDHGSADILDELDREKEYGIVLRAKGMVPCADGSWIHFDYVPGEAEVRTGVPDVTGKFCVIGSELKEDALKELFLQK